MIEDMRRSSVAYISSLQSEEPSYERPRPWQGSNHARESEAFTSVGHPETLMAGKIMFAAVGVRETPPTVAL